MKQKILDANLDTEQFKRFLEVAEYFHKELGISLTDYGTLDDYMRALITCTDAETLHAYSETVTHQPYEDMVNIELKKREDEGK